MEIITPLVEELQRKIKKTNTFSFLKIVRKIKTREGTK